MSEIPVGSKIESKNTYTIIRELGEGTYGKVWLATHEELERLVALKFLKGGEEAIRKLQKEAWVQGIMNHPNIVSVYGSDAKLGMLVTEYVDNSLEKKYLGKKEIIPLATSLTIIRDCLSALDHAHDLTVVHGDVKPANILLDKNDNAKMSDFGVSRLSGMPPEEIQGSAKWAAPEVLNAWNQHHVWAPDAQSDLFSIGVVAYLLLTGSHPFSDPTETYPTTELILREDFVPAPPERPGEPIPNEYVEVVMRLIEKNRKKRYLTAHDALIDLGETPASIIYATPTFYGLPEKVKNTIGKVVEGYRSLNFKNALFADLVTSKIVNFGAEAERWKAGELRVSAEEIEPKGIMIFRNLKEGGFCTLLVRLADFWDTATKYYEVCREIARKVKITRVFICEENVKSLENVALLKHISEDENARINTRIAFSEDITERDAIKDFGIWDDSVLCVVEKETIKGGAVDGTFVFSKTRLDQAKDWKHVIMECSSESQEVLLRKLRKLIDKRPSLLDLRESAPIMKQYSEELCEGSYMDSGGSCAWYHGSWQYLRMLDVVSTPDWHGDFYRRNISRLFSGKEEIKVLICGLADYAMLSHVLDGCKSAKVKANILVFDLCRTPLEICKWYSHKYPTDFNMETRRGDALNPQLENEYFDLIVTDAFLTRFTKNDQRKVVANWTHALKHNGIILTTIRMDRESRKWPARATKSEVDSFQERVWNLAIDRAGLLLSELAEEQIKKMAGEYASRMTSYPFGNKDEIKELFRGFDLKTDIINTAGEFRPTKYFQIVAKKCIVRDI